MLGQQGDPREPYWFAKDQWKRHFNDPEYIEAFSPRDPWGALEATIGKGYDLPPVGASFIVRHAFDSVVEANELTE